MHGNRISLACVVLTGLTVACARGQTNAEAAEVSSVAQDDLRLAVATDRERYARGDEITITLNVTNTGTAPLTLEFQTAQRFDASVADRAGSEVWRWAADRGFAQMLGAETVAPGDTLTYAATYRGDLAPGSYIAVGRLTARSHPLRAATVFAVTEP